MHLMFTKAQQAARIVEHEDLTSLAASWPLPTANPPGTLPNQLRPPGVPAPAVQPGRADRAPSDQQPQFAWDLSVELGVAIPAEVLASRRAASQWIAAHARERLAGRRGSFGH